MALITLTSDIGIQDFMPAAIKGQLLQVNKDAQVIDITHLLPPFNYPQAAYVCRNAFQNFPAGTFHIVLVDLFNEKPEYLLIAEHNGQFICCADNGLLTMILEESPQKVVAINLDKTAQKNTLHCTQVFANAIEKISSGIPMESVGDETFAIKVKNPLRPMLGINWIEGQIIFVDNFENVVVNIRKEEFEEQRRGRRFIIEFKRDEVIDRISESYADVPDGEKLALFNSAGYLEIAINKGNAAGLFGLQGYSEKLLQQAQVQFMSNQLIYQTVKVYFE